ncbi:hydrolase [Vibrio qinghaiensis]|uniref:Hydrolase n=1 Tax=Vibrio qinghaiensis TaxID=2025808 RepID=A0A223MXF8_9VIBR|nr:NlpC/P60 family protein [Vibrio qinghaiensis]ASU22260.1 hydrolase [Vibrio qinghaiensis]
MHYKKWSVVGLTILLMACSSISSVEVERADVSNEEIEAVANNQDSLGILFQRWQGVPYRLGGETLNGVDCSAFVQIAFKDAWQIPLPRTTRSQSQTGFEVNYQNAQRGDLVFFRTSRTSNHVGVYLGDKKFMHASTSKGVMISRMDNPYWASKFWQFRRIISPPNSN